MKEYKLLGASWNSGEQEPKPGLNGSTITLELDKVEGLKVGDHITADWRAGQTLHIWSIRNNTPYYVDVVIPTRDPNEWLNQANLVSGTTFYLLEK